MSTWGRALAERWSDDAVDRAVRDPVVDVTRRATTRGAGSGGDKSRLFVYVIVVSVARSILGRNVVVACDASVNGHAEWLLDTIPKLVAQGLRIQDGATFQFGWAPLLLRERAGDLVLCEPDFDDPSRGWRADVTTTLVVQADMMNVVRTYGAAPVASTYEQTLLVDVGAWTAPVVRMTRVRIDTPSDSGWLVVPEGVESSMTELARLRELVRERRAWLAPLALPRGYIVHIAGNRIVAIGTPHVRGTTIIEDD